MDGPCGLDQSLELAMGVAGLDTALTDRGWSETTAMTAGSGCRPGGCDACGGLGMQLLQGLQGVATLTTDCQGVAGMATLRLDTRTEFRHNTILP